MSYTGRQEAHRPWGLIVSVGAHAIVFAAVLFGLPDSHSLISPESPTMSVEFELSPSAPPEEPMEAAPGPEEVETVELEDIPQVEPSEVRATPRPEVIVPEIAIAKKNPVVERPSAPPPTPKKSQSKAPPAPTLPPQDKAGAPVQGTPNITDRVEQQTWEGEVLAKLERLKKYPPDARRNGDQDQILVTITIDRTGRVLRHSIARSKGFASLDAEVLSLVKRASPLPAPPKTLPDAELTFDVPVVFFTSGRRGRRR